MPTLDDVACLCALNSIAIMVLSICFCIFADRFSKILSKYRKERERSKLIEDVKCALRNGEDRDER